ncbi:MAG: bifunctional UDP-N-acetylglucosamine diphosphorylase/glucosamine-1-phosphate N-acetyltransferase GlmU [Deltaproteobacteria bacterium]|nr:bifunctional UDP-N-acetylglucosamine diphosphorylase/glucosamine-1-phosphate N-acetyltransferase GlmU [Deltaproteobacteria bacterium]
MSGESMAAVVLAAGRGTRMKSERAKVLHPVCGAALGAYPVRAARAAGADPVWVVIGHDGEHVQETLAAEGVGFVRQEQQLGTGHALLCAEKVLGDFHGALLLLCGDTPLLCPETLIALAGCQREEHAAVTVLTMRRADPAGYGRIVRNGKDLLAIVEEKDASDRERRITEVNTGIYVFEAPWVFEMLHHLGNANAQGEYYLTDIVRLAREQGAVVRALELADPDEAMGVNNRAQLAEAARIMQGRINHAHQLAGVTIVDPASTYIDASVWICVDTVIHPGVHLWGKTEIGASCLIEPGSIIRDSRIADRVHVKAHSVIEESEVGADSAIGPMAHMRPGSILRGDNKIGNFVETKKVDIGLHSKASHLTYLGDAEIGENVNIGCGTITCNYDGVNKHKTIIEDEVFVGSDTQFVAPVRVGRNSLVGAGSTIVRDVPPDALAISRAEQKNIEGWRLRHPLKKKE